jgi:hypothetical protein
MMSPTKFKVRHHLLSKHAPVTLKTYPGLGHDISPAMKADYTALLDKSLANRR